MRRPYNRRSTSVPYTIYDVLMRYFLNGVRQRSVKKISKITALARYEYFVRSGILPRPRTQARPLELLPWQDARSGRSACKSFGKIVEPELRARACYCFAMRSTGYRTITQRPLQLLAGPLILETKNAVSRHESFSRCLSSEGPRATQRRTDLRKAREMASLEHEFACGTKSSHRCVTERSTHLLGSARQQPASSAAVRACAPSWPFDRARGLVRAQAVRRHPRAAVVPWLSASCQLTARSRVRAWETLGG